MYNTTDYRDYERMHKFHGVLFLLLVEAGLSSIQPFTEDESHNLAPHNQSGYKLIIKEPSSDGSTYPAGQDQGLIF